MPTALDYLIFDYSEDDEGNATWDAMATVPTLRLPALQAEVIQVLHWAERNFPQQRGPLDEGASWDFDLSLATTTGQDLALSTQGQPLALQHAPLPAGATLTLTLTLTGRPAFAEALVHAFALE